jgi:hypothetical protein
MFPTRAALWMGRREFNIGGKNWVSTPTILSHFVLIEQHPESNEMVIRSAAVTEKKILTVTLSTLSSMPSRLSIPTFSLASARNIQLMHCIGMSLIG